jgi:trimeric autotransporter adhesin
MSESQHGQTLSASVHGSNSGSGNSNGISSSSVHGSNSSSSGGIGTSSVHGSSSSSTSHPSTPNRANRQVDNNISTKSNYSTATNSSSNTTTSSSSTSTASAGGVDHPSMHVNRAANPAGTTRRWSEYFFSSHGHPHPASSKNTASGCIDTDNSTAKASTDKHASDDSASTSTASSADVDSSSRSAIDHSGVDSVPTSAPISSTTTTASTATISTSTAVATANTGAHSTAKQPASTGPNGPTRRWSDYFFSSHPHQHHDKSTTSAATSRAQTELLADSPLSTPAISGSTSRKQISEIDTNTSGVVAISSTPSSHSAHTTIPTDSSASTASTVSSHPDQAEPRSPSTGLSSLFPTASSAEHHPADHHEEASVGLDDIIEEVAEEEEHIEDLKEKHHEEVEHAIHGKQDMGEIIDEMTEEHSNADSTASSDTEKAHVEPAVPEEHQEPTLPFLSSRLWRGLSLPHLLSLLEETATAASTSSSTVSVLGQRAYCMVTASAHFHPLMFSVLELIADLDREEELLAAGSNTTTSPGGASKQRRRVLHQLQRYLLHNNSVAASYRYSGRYSNGNGGTSLSVLNTASASTPPTSYYPLFPPLPPPQSLPSTADWAFLVLLAHVNASTLLKLANLLLLERSVLVYGQNAGVVTGVALGLQTLLLPLRWEGVFIPLLPDTAREVFSAPVPLIVGTVRSPRLQDVSEGTAVLQLADHCVSVDHTSSSSRKTMTADKYREKFAGMLSHLL